MPQTKKRKRVAVVLTVLLAVILLAAGAGMLWLRHTVGEAETAQRAGYARYQTLLRQLERSTFTVTENGAEVGSYSLAQLGMFENTRAEAAARMPWQDRMEPEDFASLPLRDKLDWGVQTHPRLDAVAADTAGLDTAAVWADLQKTERTPARDACAYFARGAYHIEPEVPGTELRTDVVENALRQYAAQMEITVDAPAAVTLELSSLDCYVLPEVTVANAGFDWDAMLRDDTAALEIPVELLDHTETLDAAALLSVDEAGSLTVDEAQLDASLEAWTTYDRQDTPYRFQSYSAEVPDEIDFLRCNYALDRETLRAELIRRLLALDGSPVTAPYLCTDMSGEPFSLGDTYVEVSIDRQVMAFYQDGELVTAGDVVTGRPWGYQTPTGLFEAWSKSPDCWLVGPDYCVFVKYWVAFLDVYYGLHDASWRTEFGGDQYLTNGSHGCVNTPDDVMKTIYDRIELDTPVLIF